LAKDVSDVETDMEESENQIVALLILALPAVFIVPQPDPGIGLVSAVFVFLPYREGLHGVYLLLSLFATVLFVSTFAFGAVGVAIGVLLIAGFMFYRNRNKRPNIIKYVLIAVGCIAFAFSVSFIFNNVFEQRHRDRFNIVLG